MGIRIWGDQGPEHHEPARHPHPRPARALRRAARARPRARRRRASSTRRSAWAATPRRSCERFPGIHLVGLDRDQDALRIAGERLAPLRRPRHARAHRLRRRSRRRSTSRRLRRGGRHPVRPRRLVAAARRRRPRLRLLAGCSARHADGPDRPGTTAADVLATYSEGELRRIFERYGEEKLVRPLRPRHHRGAARRRRSSGRAGSSRSSSPRPRTPRSAPGTRPSGCSRRCASR